MSDSEDTVVCPLCQVRVPAVGGGDALQLHYLTSCSGYDKGKINSLQDDRFFYANFTVSSESARPKAAAKTGYSSSANIYSTNETAGLSSSAAAVGGASPYGMGSATATGSTSVEASAGPSSSSGGPSDDTTSSVQFMWQPLSDISYPTITLLASFKVSGSVDIANVYVVNQQNWLQMLQIVLLFDLGMLCAVSTCT